jgi:hypothetical protein
VQLKFLRHHHYWGRQEGVVFQSQDKLFLETERQSLDSMWSYAGFAFYIEDEEGDKEIKSEWAGWCDG